MMSTEELNFGYSDFCPQGHPQTGDVCVQGSGSAGSKIMIIGEAPGANEVEVGKPFVGSAGKILNEAISGAGLERDNIYITNVVKCRPPKNRTPTEDEILAYYPFLVNELLDINPKFILLMGNVALSAMTEPVVHGITAHRGTRVFNSFIPHAVIFATFHPAATIYNKNVRENFFEDFVSFGKFIGSTQVSS